MENFNICILFSLHDIPTLNESSFLYRGIIYNESIENFKIDLFEVSSEEIESLLIPYSQISCFTKHHSNLCQDFFNQK